MGQGSRASSAAGDPRPGPYHHAGSMSPTPYVCALLGTKDHVNVFLYDGAIVPDPEGIITGGHDNKTARMISLYERDAINAPALRRMFEQIIDNNRAGGWRKLKRES
jgi:hypothetical protein